MHYNFLRLYCTLNCDVGCSNGVVTGSRGGGPAEVDSTVLGTGISNNQVPVTQHFGVVHVDRITVGAAPGNDGPGVSRGHTLQNHSLVKRHGDILRSGNDSGPLTWFRP